MTEQTTLEERVIQECDRWLVGEADHEVTEPSGFYQELKRIKSDLIQATDKHTQERATADYTRYVGQVSDDQRSPYDARWRASRGMAEQLEKSEMRS